MVVGAVRLRPAAEVVARDDAGEAAALAHAGDVDEVAGAEQVDAELLTDLVLVGVVDADLAHRASDAAAPWGGA